MFDSERLKEVRVLEVDASTSSGPVRLRWEAGDPDSKPEVPTRMTILGLPWDAARKFMEGTLGVKVGAPAVATTSQAVPAKPAPAPAPAPQPAKTNGKVPAKAAPAKLAPVPASAPAKTPKLSVQLPLALLAQLKKLDYVKEVVLALAEAEVVGSVDGMVKLCEELKTAGLVPAFKSAPRLETAVTVACRTGGLFEEAEEESGGEEASAESTEEGEGDIADDTSGGEDDEEFTEAPESE